MDTTKLGDERASTTERLRVFLPELLACFSASWCALAPWGGWSVDIEALSFTLIAELGTLMASATLVDIASRVQKPLSGWLWLLLAIGACLMYPELVPLLLASWSMDWLIFLPFAWSIYERIALLMQLPRATRLQKIRARVLTFDRVYLGVLIGAFAMLGGFIYWSITEDSSDIFLGVLPWALSIFFTATALNAWRVYQVRFAKAPRSLLPWMDQGDGVSLNKL